MGCGIRSSASAASGAGAAGAAIWRSIREPSALVLPLIPFDEALRPRPVRVSGLASPVGYSGKLHLALSLPRLAESGRRTRCWEAVFCSVRCEGCGWRYQVMSVAGKANQSELLAFSLLSSGEDNLHFTLVPRVQLC